MGEGRGEGKTTAPLSDDRSVITDNRLKTYNGTTYYYDNFGNLIHREVSDGEVQNYFYDLHDQLVKAEIFKKDGSKETWVYTYDALGRRIGKGRLKNEEVSETSFPHDLSGNGLENQTRFVWDGSHLLQEIHPDGRYTYIYTDQDSYEPLAQVRDWTTENGENRQQTHYFHCDQIGIPREMTDKDGNLLWFGNYTGWGRLKEETKVTDSACQPFRLQNQYADRETGLHYNFFRYYEPDAGRFVNQDPIGLNGAVNLYLFSFNMTKWIDPLGLNPMNGATVTVIATIAGKQPISVTVSSANKVHAEIRALQQLRAQGALVGADVKIKDVTGHFPNKENKEVQVCAKCRHDIFEELIKGEANSVTIPIKGGGVIVIMKAQFEAAQKGTAKVLNDFEGSRQYKARSDKQFEELRKHQSGC